VTPIVRQLRTAADHQANVQTIVAAITQLLDERETAGNDPASLRAWRKRFVALRVQLDELLPGTGPSPVQTRSAHPRIAESVSYPPGRAGRAEHRRPS
jgi:hypothetical protein